MSKFALQRNRKAFGKVQIFDLVKDGKNQVNEFTDSLEEKYRSQFRSLLAYVSFISDNRVMPTNKHKKLHTLQDTYELKTKNLRLYYLNFKSYDIILCLGGHKNAQAKDINSLTSLRKRILEQINESGDLTIIEDGPN